MKCTTCQQTDFNSLHGRVFCANCGVDAQKRLQEFQQQVAAANPERIMTPEAHVLDLSTTNVQSQPAAPNPIVPAPITTPAPAVSLAGLSGPVAPPEATAQAAPVPTSAPFPPAQPPSRWQTLTPAATQPVAPVSAPVVDSLIRSPAPISSTTPDLPATPMQPHQTYSLKSEAVAQPTFNQPTASGEEAGLLSAQLDAQPTTERTNWWRRLFSRGVVQTGSVVLSVVMLATYITYLNYPGIAVRVAASRANIEAGLPGYVPAGYRFDGPIAYSPGQLRISFRRDEGSRISVSQSTTRWDSRSLLEDHVKLQASTYETYRENGLTIYTYDDRYATWVNSGMLYTIESDGQLSIDEIVKMASSL